MNLLQRIFEKAVLAIAPTRVEVGERVYDALVIHDDDSVRGIPEVEYNGVNYGLIHRNTWKIVEDNATTDIAAFDDKQLAAQLIIIHAAVGGA